MMIDYSGQQIGSYRLLRRLGFGGFASVYLGQHVRIATKQAAIKLLHMFDVDSQKFQQEAETTAALDHPHIIRLIDFDFHDQMPFLVIDYAPGGSLRSRHPEGTQVPLPTVVQYVQEIANALEYAHGKNVIHRDIKPDNILIGGQGELRLDFLPNKQGPAGTSIGHVLAVRLVPRIDSWPAHSPVNCATPSPPLRGNRSCPRGYFSGSGSQSDYV